MRPVVCLTSMAVVAMAFSAAASQLVHAMPEPWFRLDTDERGGPTYLPLPTHNRAQREALGKLCWLSSEGELREVERALDGVESGRERVAGFSQGGAWGGRFLAGGQAVLWDDYDSERKVFCAPSLELEMPLSEFAELFRAWAASVRHWRRLTELHGDPLPRELWPASYPPPTRG